MKLNKVIIVIGAILLLSGFVFTLMPHDVHNIIIGEVVQEEHSHAEHNLFGYVIALIGLAIAGAGWKIRR